MHPELSSKRESALLLVLAGIQFSHILDFMIMMPLGPQLIDAFHISDSQFGLLVSAYTFAAGLSGLLASTYVDRFERKRLLSVLYALFAVATFSCAFAPGFGVLMVARVAAGLFGGVLSAMTQTIVGDVIPFARRGKAMGVVMTAFSVSSVMGVPVSLWVAAHSSWHAPFVGVGVLSVVLLLIAQYALPTMGQHLVQDDRLSTTELMKQVLGDANHWRGFALSFFMIFAGFSIIPYITLYMQTNAGLSSEQIPLVYLCGGAATLFTANILGKLTDRWGKVPTFCAVTAFSIVPMTLVTNVAGAPLPVILLVTTCFFVFVSGRRIPAMALLASVTKPNLRGTFITLNTSIQSAGMGLGALLGGMLISRDSQGLLAGYWMCSVMALVGNLLTIWMVRRLKVRD